MRYDKIDILRWTAITLMIIFHFNYTLSHIFWIDILEFTSVFWYIVWKLAGFGFISISWISFFLAEKKYWKDINKKYLRYSLIIWSFALLISLITYLFIPSQLIVFGILHFFAFSFILILFLRKLSYYNFLISFLILCVSFLVSMKTSFDYLAFLWFRSGAFYSADYYPLIPYFWVYLLSYTTALFLDNKWYFLKIFWWEKNGVISKVLKYIWEYSLIIYLIHEPIIIVLIYLYINNV